MVFLQAKGSANIENGRETTTAGVMHYSWIKGGRCGRTAKESRGTTKNTEELANPKCGSSIRDDEDLLVLTSGGDTSRFSGQDRSMQRPWLVQTGCAAAPAELGLWGVERRKTTEREE